MITQSALHLIGNTPLIQLRNLYSGPGKLYAKLESINPGGSIKDRAALRILNDAYASGELVRGQPVVEMTSGNTGAGLAVVCNVMGNPFTAIMSSGQSPERARMLRALGAEVQLVPQVSGTAGKVTGDDIAQAESHARTLAIETKAFYVDQFNRPGSVSAHEEGTGPEIWRQLDGKVHAFVSTVGSAGTLIGTSRALKKMNPGVHCVGVEPAGARVLAGQGVSNPQHIAQGTGYGFVPPHWDPGVVDELMAVTDDEVAHFTRALAIRESLLVGYSSGANVCAALKILESGRLPPDATVVTVLCDTGLKYNFG